MSDAITYDVIADLKNELCTQWCVAVCVAPKPRFDFIFDAKATGFIGATQSTVLIEPLKEQIVSFQLHADSWKHELPVKIDIRTFSGLARQNATVKEIGRILKNIVRRASAAPVTFIDAHLRGGETMDENYRNLFRYVFTIVYRDVTPFTFT